MLQILHKNLFQQNLEFANMQAAVLNFVNQNSEIPENSKTVDLANKFQNKSQYKFLILNNQNILEENLIADNYSDFLRAWNQLRKLVYKKFSQKNLTVLNLVFNYENSENQENDEKTETSEDLDLADNYLNNLENLEQNTRDIALMRSLSSVNIFVPADNLEAEYLLKSISSENLSSNITSQDFEKNNPDLNLNLESNNSLSNVYNLNYFRISKNSSPAIFNAEYFEKKNYNGLPEIIYLSKKLDNYLQITLITCGPILYNVLLAAIELEKNNFSVTVINVSTLHSNLENIQKNINNFFINLAKDHKNILTVEEHSKIGGLGSMICEFLSKEKNLKIARLGIEDNLSPRNIMTKAEAIVGW